MSFQDTSKFKAGFADDEDDLQAENEWLRGKLTEIHEISQDTNAPAWQLLQNIAATASRALLPKDGTP